MAHRNLSTKEKETHRHSEQTCDCQGGGGGRRMDWEFEVSRCKILYILIELINKRSYYIAQGAIFNIL